MSEEFTSLIKKAIAPDMNPFAWLPKLNAHFITCPVQFLKGLHPIITAQVKALMLSPIKIQSFPSRIRRRNTSNNIREILKSEWVLLLIWRGR